MAEFDAESLRKDVNKSGFPFQLKVADQINSAKPKHPWSVESSEHSWVDPESGSRGFIDLVLAHETSNGLKLIVECKRPLGGRWIFLVDRKATPQSMIKSFWASGDSPPKSGWDDLPFQPVSLEASDCIIAGQDERSPLLERLADGLLQSINGVSDQEQKIFERYRRCSLRIYIPVIVTAAELFVCYVDPTSEISIDGVLAKSVTFESVDHIRFRKSLASKLNYREISHTLRGENLQKARSVWIFNANNLVESLRQLDLIRPTKRELAIGLGHPWPWAI